MAWSIKQQLSNLFFVLALYLVLSLTSIYGGCLIYLSCVKKVWIDLMDYGNKREHRFYTHKFAYL